MKKLNFDDVREIFNPADMVGFVDTQDMRRLSKATKRNHKHNHNPSKRPSVVMGKYFTIQTPAQWRKEHAGKAT